MKKRKEPYVVADVEILRFENFGISTGWDIISTSTPNKMENDDNWGTWSQKANSYYQKARENEFYERKV